MATNCDPDALESASRCYKCIPKGLQTEVIIYLLASLAGGSTDPNVLMEQAKCMRCIPSGMQAEVQLYLLCQIANL